MSKEESPYIVAEKIKSKIKLLETGRGLLEGLGNDKALAIALYDKELAITLMRLKNGKALSLEDEIIKDPPASTCEKIAKGIVWESKLRLEQSEAAYKNGVSKLQSVEAELNALQSLNRHLSET
ncbi:MAG: hypothetical protein PHG53_09675 [Phycisphaerae bacterium]|nr:hypothetical protein [Phycisphaerae bacterium]